MTRKTKILQVLPSLNVEDVPHSRIQLAKFLVQSGYDSYLLSNGGNMRETLEKAGVKDFNLLVHKKDLFSFRTISKIRSLLLKEQFNTLYPYGMVEANKKSTMRLKIREFYKLKDKPKPNKNDQFTTDCAHKKVLSVYEELLLKSA